MEKKSLKDLKKEYRSLKREPCEGCENYYECDVCKPHFDKLRAKIRAKIKLKKLEEEK